MYSARFQWRLGKPHPKSFPRSGPSSALIAGNIGGALVIPSVALRALLVKRGKD